MSSLSDQSSTFEQTAVPAVPNSLESRTEIHPLIHAGRWLAADLLSTLFFVALYAATKNVYLATAVGIAAGVGQIAYLKIRGKPIDAMQWLSLGLVVVFGAASLLTRDPRFVMAKPTMIYAALGFVMLRKGWMARYLPADVLMITEDVTIAFGFIWSGLMFLTAVLNLAVLATVDVKTWTIFIGVFPIASKLALFSVQYLTTRAITIARIRAEPALAFTHG